MNLILPEEDLVIAIINRTKNGAEALYDKYSLPLYKVILSKVHEQKLAEDILQNCLYKIWNSIDDFHPKDNRFPVWIMGIARNLSKQAVVKVMVG